MAIGLKTKRPIGTNVEGPKGGRERRFTDIMGPNGGEKTSFLDDQRISRTILPGSKGIGKTIPPLIQSETSGIGKTVPDISKSTDVTLTPAYQAQEQNIETEISNQTVDEAMKGVKDDGSIDWAMLLGPLLALVLLWVVNQVLSMEA